MSPSFHMTLTRVPSSHILAKTRRKLPKLQEEMTRLRIPCKDFLFASYKPECVQPRSPLAVATAAEKSSFCVAGIEWSRSKSFATALAISSRSARRNQSSTLPEHHSRNSTQSPCEPCPPQEGTVLQTPRHHLHDDALGTAAGLGFAFAHFHFVRGSVASSVATAARRVALHLAVKAPNLADDIVESLVNVDAGLGRCLDEAATKVLGQLLTL